MLKYRVVAIAALFLSGKWQGKWSKTSKAKKSVMESLRERMVYTAQDLSISAETSGKMLLTLPGAQNWPDDVKRTDEYGHAFTPSTIIVDDGYEYWVNHVVGDFAPNTRHNYCERYIHNIQPVIADMGRGEKRTLTCQQNLGASS